MLYVCVVQMYCVYSADQWLASQAQEHDTEIMFSIPDLDDILENILLWCLMMRGLSNSWAAAHCSSLLLILRSRSQGGEHWHTEKANLLLTSSCSARSQSWSLPATISNQHSYQHSNILTTFLIERFLTLQTSSTIVCFMHLPSIFNFTLAFNVQSQYLKISSFVQYILK